MVCHPCIRIGGGGVGPSGLGGGGDLSMHCTSSYRACALAAGSHSSVVLFRVAIVLGVAEVPQIEPVQTGRQHRMGAGHDESVPPLLDVEPSGSQWMLPESLRRLMHTFSGAGLSSTAGPEVQDPAG